MTHQYSNVQSTCHWRSEVHKQLRIFKSNLSVMSPSVQISAWGCKQPTLFQGLYEEMKQEKGVFEWLSKIHEALPSTSWLNADRWSTGTSKSWRMVRGLWNWKSEFLKLSSFLDIQKTFQWYEEKFHSLAEEVPTFQWPLLAFGRLIEIGMDGIQRAVCFPLGHMLPPTRGHYREFPWK